MILRTERWNPMNFLPPQAPEPEQVWLPLPLVVQVLAWAVLLVL
jgi:hypothetical protein